MLPGTKYSVEDVLRVAWRRRWWILLPGIVVATAAVVAGKHMPDKYMSETLIAVIPKRIPESYVRTTVTARLEDRIASISQQITSRTRLERIIQEFNLYPEQRRMQTMEAVVERMRADIKVDIVKGDIRIRHFSDQPLAAMRVVDRLASLLMEENLRDRESMADVTNQFLDSQLEDARQRLVDHEKKLEAFRRQYAGELPTQVPANLQVIQTTQLQLQSLADSLNRDRDRRLVLERAITDVSVAVPEPAAAGATPAADREGPTGATAAEQLQSARAALAALELRLRPDHPDVIRLRRTVSDLQAKAALEAMSIPAAPAVPVDAGPERRRQNRAAELRAEIDNLSRQIAHKEAEEVRLRGVLALYQRRVDVAPTRESEMTELTRDYATLQNVYTNLLAKREESKVAANLERQQIGEQFTIIDRARLPERPISPNRILIDLIGIVVGFSLGTALAVLLEYRDSSVRTDDEVSRVLALPVLAMIPVMPTARDARAQFRRRLIHGAGIGVTLAACVGAVLWTVLW